MSNQLLLTAPQVCGHGSLRHKIADVFAGGKFLQAEQVRSGIAYIYARYLNNCPDAVAVRRAEALTRRERLGVWSGSYFRLWEWRKQQRQNKGSRSAVDSV